MNNKYYNEIDRVLRSYEEYRPWHDKKMNWVANRIDWAWKFRKITEEQMAELASRATAVFEDECFSF